jgi:hypothetical protein
MTELQEAASRPSKNSVFCAKPMRNRPDFDAATVAFGSAAAMWQNPVRYFCGMRALPNPKAPVWGTM